ncbi:hypothetical protein VTL71DRAFT_8075 [Oculimacula yallundae]|uniref:Uncharacterized protein n=1 Tax=Oculimacula yallundae TaxID=86028 RepID=A0ABR4CXI5_9HELO
MGSQAPSNRGSNNLSLGSILTVNGMALDWTGIQPSNEGIPNIPRAIAWGRRSILSETSKYSTAHTDRPMVQHQNTDRPQTSRSRGLVMIFGLLLHAARSWQS